MPRKPAGRPKSVRTSQNIAAVRTLIEQSSSRSARKHASTWNLRRFLHCDLKLQPYKIMFAQELSPVDWEKRKDYCNMTYCSASKRYIVE